MAIHTSYPLSPLSVATPHDRKSCHLVHHLRMRDALPGSSDATTLTIQALPVRPEILTCRD